MAGYRYRVVVNKVGEHVFCGPRMICGPMKTKGSAYKIVDAVNSHAEGRAATTALRGIVNARDSAALADDPAYYGIDAAIEAARKLLAKTK